MLRSMTGFGKAQLAVEGGSILVEVKSLNSKFLDLNLRIPADFSDKELEVRNLVQDQMERGKISVSVNYEKQMTGQAHAERYREEQFIAHYLELKKLADRVMAPYDTLFEVALRSPDVAISENGKASALAQEKLMEVVAAAIGQCNHFRDDEGKTLAEKLKEYAANISNGLNQVEKMDAGRIDKVRDRIRKNVSTTFGSEGFDKNRLEQEILFYAERLDIHEERVRLRTHLSYFNEAMNTPASSGKKLGFITQEIGREINTIGSKANDAEIQREVVGMKEELEKIKEQLNNVL